MKSLLTLTCELMVFGFFSPPTMEKLCKKTLQKIHYGKQKLLFFLSSLQIFHVFVGFSLPKCDAAGVGEKIKEWSSKLFITVQIQKQQLRS